MKRFLIRAIRFLIRQITLFFNRFSKNYFKFSHPFNYVQNITEHNIHSYLELKISEMKTWIIVGVGEKAIEIPHILKKYPNIKIIGFECSQRYVKRLEKKFKDNSRVEIIEKAISSSNGISNFYETSFSGSGSLLELGDLHKKIYSSKEAESFSVETITLDSYFNNDQDIDLLQIDVQGAEKLVLEGAIKTLKRTKAIFIEISAQSNYYKNSVTFDELISFLTENGFIIVLLGTDFNLLGNALFINRKILNLD